MTAMRVMWVCVFSSVSIACDPGTAPQPPPPSEAFVQTRGSKEAAILAVRGVGLLSNALRNQDVNEVQRLALNLGRLNSDVTIGQQIGSDGSRTPFVEPTAPTPGSPTGCDGTGCSYANYRTEGIYPNLVDGTVRTELNAAQTIEISLRATDLTATLQPTSYMEGAFLVTATTVDGAVTVVETFPDRREEPKSMLYQGVTFDSGADLARVTPTSGSIAAESTTGDYDTGFYTTQATTISFP